MMKREILKVSIRNNALYIPNANDDANGLQGLNETTSVLLANCTKLGFTFSEDLLHAVNSTAPKFKLEVFEILKELTGVNKNWTPLVKQWNIPTGESITDHLITWFANIIGSKRGIKLACGHIIPKDTFPLERYNGCPFCGTPFEFEQLDYSGDHGKLKTLELWTDTDLENYFKSLLESPVALDANQIDNLKTLINHLEVDVSLNIKMKETLMIVIDGLVESGCADKASQFFKAPNDILRYLWYKHTGFLQIVEPKTIVNRIAKNARHYNGVLDRSATTKIKAVDDLKLKYSRSESIIYATWLNCLEMDIQAQCENMHPKRGIWIRMIRALRLSEYSKRKGFEKLAKLLDTFYNEDYEVWQGKVNQSKLKSDAATTFKLLKQRPGLFARSLFSTMLWFGPEITIQNFKEVIHQVPARLIYTLNMYADIYFDKSASRTVKPLGGNSKKIPVNELLQLYTDESLTEMKLMIQDLSLEVIKLNLAKVENENQTIFIDEGLYNIPIAIGDRNEQLQDVSSALMGTKFKVEGDTVRLFLQWGEGLPAQHLDMDLSCKVAYANKVDFCSYSQLVIQGCKHSGDIQRIPEKVGTAEYIDIDLNQLETLGAKYVSFACNAYSVGNLEPNLVVGWMNSQYPMKISKNGVAYDPTAVQHQVRIQKTLTKGMVFGVLDVVKREIVWLEMSFGGQVVQNLSIDTVESLLKKLEAKLKIGDLLKLKAEVQNLTIVEHAEAADEVYDMNWALNTAEVSKLFL